MRLRVFGSLVILFIVGVGGLLFFSVPGGVSPLSTAAPGTPAIRALAWRPGGEAAAMRVMTYNIRHGVGDDRRVDLAATAEVILESGADLVALQEVDRFQVRSGMVDQAQWLADRLGMEAAFGANLRRGLGRYGNALLSRYPILSVQNVLLPGRLEQRGVLVARVLTPVGPVTVLATHLGLSRSDRRLQAAAVAEWAAAAARDGEPVILLGDWNAAGDATELADVTGSFRSALAEAGVSPGFTFRARQPAPFIGIDHAFFSEEWEIREAAVLTQSFSDHLPVLVEVLVPQREGL